MAALGTASTGSAQPLATFDLLIEAASDVRRRGLSWSGGRPALAAVAALPIAPGLSLGLAAATLRGSRRHGRADAVLDADARASLDRGPWRLSAGVAWHAFPGGRGTLDYGEASVGAGLLIGPLQADVAARYAPGQRAIGGDNLNVALDLSAALPGTPWTLSAGVGHSLGDGGDAARAKRLRPEGNYTDWRLGAEHVRGPLGIGLTYTDTSIAGRAGSTGPFTDHHIGARLTAHARLFL